MSKRRDNRRRRTSRSPRFFTAVIETLGLGMVIGSLLVTLSFVFLQAYDRWVRK